MNQACRESLIELLFQSLYLDDRLSLAEDKELSEALDSIGWESELGRETFILGAFARVREAISTPAGSEEFFQSRADVLCEHKEGAASLTWLSRVLAADGMSPGEQRFLDRLESRFYR